MNFSDGIVGILQIIAFDLFYATMLVTPGNRYCMLTHRGPVDLRKWAIFNTILMSPKSWLSQEDLDAGCEHSMVPVDS